MSQTTVEDLPVQTALADNESSYKLPDSEESAPNQSAHTKSTRNQFANEPFSQSVMDKQSANPRTPHEKNTQPGMPQTQNPELLHWRANVLLDEMMLGAIDIAAGDSVPARALTPKQSSAPTDSHRADSHRTESQRTEGNSQSISPSANHTVNQANGTHDAEYRQSVAPHSGMTSYQQQTARADGGVAPSVAQDGERRVAQSKQSETEQSQSQGGQAQPGHGTEQWLFAAEQRYQQIAARQQANRRSTPASEYDGWSMAVHEQDQSGVGDPYSNSGYGYDMSVGGVSSASATEYSTNPNRVSNGDATQTAAARSATSTSTAGYGTQDGGRRGVRKSLRSNLLPRMNVQDSRTIQQEMGLLQSGIESVLPAAHESRVRAQHLLQKAHTILQNDPSRSAEVDYYLQQVRTILQRVQETAHWSNLYRSRLYLYLFGWLALSVIVIMGRYFYTGPMSNWLAWMTASSTNSLLVYNLLTLGAAFFFGALGGGAGALLNMARHAKQDHGFFDRKYGLRGLILPVIGAAIGLFLCLASGVFYALVGIDPAASVWFGLLPALIALALGASQEFFYGIRA